MYFNLNNRWPWSDYKAELTLETLLLFVEGKTKKTTKTSLKPTLEHTAQVLGDISRISLLN